MFFRTIRISPTARQESMTRANDATRMVQITFTDRSLSLQTSSTPTKEPVSTMKGRRRVPESCPPPAQKPPIRGARMMAGLALKTLQETRHSPRKPKSGDPVRKLSCLLLLLLAPPSPPAACTFCVFQRKSLAILIKVSSNTHCR